MKITKQRILQIIKEEVEAAQQDDTNTKQKLRKDFLTVANKFLPDADMVSAEVELTSALMNKILKKAGEAGTSATQLKRLNDIAGKLLAEEKDTLEEMAPPVSKPSFSTAKSGIRRDLIRVKNDPGNQLKAFLTKYADLKMKNGQLAAVTPKTPYAGYDKLSEEDQKKYVNAVSTAVNNLLTQYWDQINQIYNLSDTAATDIPNPEEEQENNSPPPFNAEEVKQAVADANTTEDQINVMATATAQVANAKNVKPEEAAEAVVQTVVPGASDEVKKAVAAKAEEAGAEEEPEIEIKPLLDKFFKLLTRTNILGPPKNLNESLRSLLDALGAENMKVVGSSLRDNFEPRELKALGTYFKNKENVLTFVKQYFTNNPEYEQIIQKLTAQPADEPAAEEPKTDEKGVVKLKSGDKAIPSQFDELVDEFKRFSDDDDGFMMKAYLKDQDVLLKDLRSALRKFIGLENLEAALKEAEEPTPEPKSEPTPEPKPEDKTKGSRESLVKHVSRYRRDINDVSKVLAQYLQQAKAGTYKAQPILNKLKDELQNLQDDNALIIRDLKALAGLEESLLLEEESREEKIANVRNAYDEIVDLLRPLLNVETEASQPPKETEKEDTVDEQQNEELIIEDIYLEAVITPTEEELQSYVIAVKDALTEIDSIKKYFRLTGTFNRPLEEVKNDFVEYIQDYKETMSDLVSDLKTGVPDPNKADQYVRKFAKLAKQIQEDFGISPKKLIKTPEVTVAPVDADDKKAAINPSPEAKEVAKTSGEDKKSTGDITDTGDAADTSDTTDTGDIAADSDAEEAEIPITFDTLDKIIKTTAIDNYSNLMVAVQNDNTRKAQSIIARFKKAAEKPSLEEAGLSDSDKDAIRDFQKLKAELKELIEEHGLKIVTSGTTKEKAHFANVLKSFVDQYEALANLHAKLEAADSDKEEATAESKAKEEGKKVVSDAKEAVVKLDDEPEGEFTDKIKGLYSSIISSIKSMFGLDPEEDEELESEKAPKQSKKYKKFIKDIEQFWNPDLKMADIDRDNIKQFRDFVRKHQNATLFSPPDPDAERALEPISDIILNFNNGKYLAKYGDKEAMSADSKKSAAENDYYSDLARAVEKIIKKNKENKENLLERLIRQELKVLNGKKMVRY